jgi:hypothetical protein
MAVSDSIYTPLLHSIIQWLANLSLPSFSFEIPVFLALLSYGLVPFLAYYHRHLKKTGRE